ncbi:hypothetical protein TNCV_3548661 [Trichonephila clavipes]|nr:hypothetical protein TNCV_3548661 [Trichonephila clavipes]
MGPSKISDVGKCGVLRAIGDIHVLSNEQLPTVASKLLFSDRCCVWFSEILRKTHTGKHDGSIEYASVLYRGHRACGCHTDSKILLINRNHLDRVVRAMDPHA